MHWPVSFIKFVKDSDHPFRFFELDPFSKWAKTASFDSDSQAFLHIKAVHACLPPSSLSAVFSGFILQMELIKMLLVLVFVSSIFCCTCVQGRNHHHGHHHKHQSHSSIAQPPMAVAHPPSEPPPLITPKPVFPPAAPPQPIGGGSSSSSPGTTPSVPPTPPPTPLPPNYTTVYDVRTYGARGDGASDDTRAFKSAWDSACEERGPGVILVPRGCTFMIQSTIFAGPCKSELTLQVDGTLVAPDGPDSWPQSNNKRQWLVFYRADGLSLRGGGLIDGRGEKWWNLPCKPHKGPNGTTLAGPCDSPVALRFFMSSNLTVHGIKVQNSPQFHFRFDNCRNVTIDTIAISSPALSPNTDGIHVQNSVNVGIYNSLVSNGDDCVSIGAGSMNINVRNVTCGPGHGISIGSLGKENSRACVTNITVTNSVIRNSDNGVRIKTWQGGSGSVTSVNFENIHMDSVRNPIIIDQYYCLTKACKNQTNAVFVTDISYTNIKGTYDIRSPPIHLGCSDSVPCTNITLIDVELLPAKGDIISDPFCWNVYGAAQTLTIPPVSCLLQGLPRLIMDIDSDRCY